MNPKITLVLICYHFVLTKCNTDIVSSSHREFQKVAERIAKNSVIQYGHNCSYQDESKRLKFVKHIIDAVFAAEFTENSDASRYTEEANQLIHSTGNFCDSYRNLECNSYGICECTFTNNLGLTIASVRENGQCLLKRGSLCAPSMPAQSIGNPLQADIKCQNGSSCFLNRNGHLCTGEGIMKEIKNSLGRDGAELRIVLKALLKQMKAGLCVCSDGKQGQAIATGYPSSASIVGNIQKCSFIFMVLLGSQHVIDF